MIAYIFEHEYFYKVYEKHYRKQNRTLNLFTCTQKHVPNIK